MENELKNTHARTLRVKIPHGMHSSLEVYDANICVVAPSNVY
jgi:hypothetical protein